MVRLKTNRALKLIEEYLYHMMRLHTKQRAIETHHTSCINNIRGKMNLSKPDRFMVCILNRRIIIIRKRSTHKRIREGRLANCTKAKDSYFTADYLWIWIVWHLDLCIYFGVFLGIFWSCLNQCNCTV